MQNCNYLSFFGLCESPFKDNLDPRFLFLTPQLEKAFSEVMDRIYGGNCFAVIMGEVGTGKTTLMHRLKRQLMQQGRPTAFLIYPHLNRTHLLDFIFTDFGIPCNSVETVDDWKRLENWLVERHCGDQTPVLLVDEAQGLPTSAFQEIRMLLNLETSRGKLLQVVLAGELELEEKLNRVQMRGLRQRITVRCKTATLNRDETFDYVQNRLHVGGANSRPLFQPNAMDAIYFHSRGIPRVVNVLCEQALMNACADQVNVVTPHLVQEVARAFQWEDARFPPATGGPMSLATVSSAAAARIAAPELPLMASQAVLDEQPSVSPALPSPLAQETSSEVPLNNRSQGPIQDPPTVQVHRSPENFTVGTLGRRLIDVSSRVGEKKLSPELTNSSPRHLLVKLIRKVENRIKHSHSSLPANIRERRAGQSARPPLADKIDNRRSGPLRQAASLFCAWWFYGSSPSWWKEIDAVVTLPHWRKRNIK
jgi:general secretion pathway protein A